MKEQNSKQEEQALVEMANVEEGVATNSNTDGANDKEPEVPATDVWHGLTTQQAQDKLAADGYNELDHDEEVPIWKLFVMQFTSFIIILLCVAAIASFALGEYVEGIAIIIIVLLNASITVYTEKSASDALAALANMSEPLTVVVRNGESKPIATREVVVGDVILIEAGDIVSADAHLVESADLKVNEMPLTGESVDVSKSHVVKEDQSKKLTPTNRIFAGTTVSAGTGTAIVVATGMHTRVGRIARMLMDDSGEKPNCIGVKPPKRTPLQDKLHNLGVLISIWAIAACICVFMIGAFARDYRDPEHPNKPPILQVVLVAVSLAVSAIPESLPLCVTVCLALGVKAMADECNSLVRRLPAVETLGSAQVICSDKTGTLTEGKMTALKVWCLGKTQAVEHDREIQVTGQGLTPVGEFLEDGNQIADVRENDVQISTTLLAAALNCTAELKLAEDADTVRSIQIQETKGEFATKALGQKWVAQGNTSEVPIVVLAAKAGIFPIQYDEQHPSVGYRAYGKTGAEVPFSSERKMMISVVHADDGTFGNLNLPDQAKHVVLLKGAPNFILDKCTKAIFNDKTFDNFDEAAKKRVLRGVDDLSSQALRVLAVAIRPMESLPYDPADGGVEAEEKFRVLNDELTFVGLVASMDPEREGVRDAIGVAREAGVKTIMITGDYVKTAIAIAKNISLITFNDDPDEVALDCNALRPYGNQYLPAYEIDEITSRCVVFARAQPEDKLQIVQSLQRQGLVASMTGDGVNDAPALNEADIGVAMGINGTEVAKAASDMILLDDNFVTIVAAIAKGRQIYANIQKFVTYFIGTNATAVLLIFFSVVIGVPIPFNPLVILFINLSIDGTVAMAISVQPADPNIMKAKPRPRTQPLLTDRLWSSALGHALVLFSMVSTVYLTGLYLHTGKVLMHQLVPGGDPIEVCKVYNDNGTWDTVEDKNCAGDGLVLARSMAFITMMFSEVFRGLTVKSLEPVFDNFFANRALIACVIGTSILGLLLLVVPGLNDVFGLAGDELEYWAWFMCISAAGVVVASDEIIKYCFRRQDVLLAEKDQTHDFFHGVLAEMRQLRHHLTDIETKLQLREDRPVRRLEIQESAKALAHALAAEVGQFSDVQRQAIEGWSTHTYRSHSVLPGDDHQV